MKQRAILVIIYGVIFLLIGLHGIIFNLTELINMPVDLLSYIFFWFLIYFFMIISGLYMLKDVPAVAWVNSVVAIGIILKTMFQAAAIISFFLQMGFLAGPLLFAPNGMGITDIAVSLLLRLFFMAMDIIALILIMA